MTSDPEEQVRLQGYGEMTLRTAVETLMLLAPRERSEAKIFRVRDGVPLAQSEIAELASNWGIAREVRSPKLVPEQHWQDVVRGMVRDAPLPSLIVAFLVGVLIARR
ncbi:hypothetical protein [Bradyrhizobium sp. DOA9]|uniref:hypothetical protein n=1 Tax=Bradyrhizobium sp. DOA9 TaxID=1126627 RepID=UPI0004685E80|nr:hypothetical protein [Bradyrhizobium sp. DOA9]GAJ33584.1 hypothetical protein BDOA9_0127810 [Bradyrhizobium sp. DOA9]